MWFEVNVRLSEVTDLKWPHGTEWQCGNSTLATSWPNHVQILSFASMASRQGAVKHGLVSKIAGGCSSYDVIAPWPDLTWSIVLPKVAQGLPHKVPQNPAARKTSVGAAPPPPCPGEGYTLCDLPNDLLCVCLSRWLASDCDRPTRASATWNAPSSPYSPPAPATPASGPTTASASTKTSSKGTWLLNILPLCRFTRAWRFWYRIYDICKYILFCNCAIHI